MDEETRLIRAGKPPGRALRTVAPPIQRGSTVLLPTAADLYDERQQTYGRQGLATQDALRDALAELEGGKSAQLYPSGIAALSGAMLAVLKAGDEVLAADCVYRPTRRFCDTVLKRFGVNTRYYPGDLAPAELLAMAGPATRLIVMESPGSLTFEMQDVAAIAARAREKGILTLIDNTWAAGLLFKPLVHGVDLSVQSLTKYVGGHSDVFMGAAVTANDAIGRQLTAGIHEMGWSVSPDDAYQMLRGLRTLPTRMERHGRNGLEVAHWLKAQPEVVRLLHPALPGSVGHDLWARDYSGACGLFGFILRPGPPKAVEALLDTLTLFGLGFSWGGFESLAIHCDPQLGRRQFPPNLEGPLVRLHVGLESPADLIADLRCGLDAFNALA
ncbi:MAG: metC [Caulobacter sp.]|nr:metC [Caulobacter sp.]